MVPWTKCGSCAWSGGPSMAATLGPGGPLIVWQADWSCYVKWLMSQSMKVDQWVSRYWFLALLLQHGLFLHYYSTSDFQLLTACCNKLSQYGWFSYSSLLPTHKVSELTSQTMQLSTMKIILWPVQGVLWPCSLESQLVVSIVWIICNTFVTAVQLVRHVAFSHRLFCTQGNLWASLQNCHQINSTR